VTTVPSHPGRIARLTSIAVVGATVAVAAGCSGGNPQAHDPATSSAAGSTEPTATTMSARPSTADVAGRQALASYQAMWHDMTVAARTADYRSPLLPQHASGDALAGLVHGLYLDQRQGIVTKGSVTTSPTVTAVSPLASPTTVRISDCLDARHWLNYKRDGSLQDNTPGSRHKTAAVVSHGSAGWKVSQLSVGAPHTC